MFDGLIKRKLLFENKRVMFIKLKLNNRFANHFSTLCKVWINNNVYYENLIFRISQLNSIQSCVYPPYLPPNYSARHKKFVDGMLQSWDIAKTKYSKFTFNTDIAYKRKHNKFLTHSWIRNKVWQLKRNNWVLCWLAQHHHNQMK